MSKLLIIFIPLFIFSCSTHKHEASKKTCFILYNMQTKQFEQVQNDVACHRLLPACSTFKVALSVMGFDAGVLKDEQHPTFKWDGEKRMIEAWNQNQTPQSWMRNSVVWVSQEITPKLGEKKIADYLKKFDYGNQNSTSGLKYSWLTPELPAKNSLKISAYQQISFLDRLWRGELKTSQRSQKLTRNIMGQDQSPTGFILTGKTGSGFVDVKNKKRVGWFVGHLQKDKTEYLVVVNFTDKKSTPNGKYGGYEAKETAIKLLSQHGLW